MNAATNQHSPPCTLSAPRLRFPQAVELKATKIVHVGPSDAATYPIAKKKTTYEFLREKMHLRPRSNTISAVARIRNALAFATHRFFQENGFLYVHTPIITASDCEGAGEMFQARVRGGAGEAGRAKGRRERKGGLGDAGGRRASGGPA